MKKFNRIGTPVLGHSKQKVSPLMPRIKKNFIFAGFAVAAFFSCAQIFAALPPSDSAGAQDARFRDERERSAREQKRKTAPLIITTETKPTTLDAGSAQFGVEKIQGAPAVPPAAIQTPAKAALIETKSDLVKTEAPDKSSTAYNIKSLFANLKQRFLGSSKDQPADPISKTSDTQKKDVAPGSQQFGMEKAIFVGPGIPPAPIAPQPVKLTPPSIQTTTQTPATVQQPATIAQPAPSAVKAAAPAATAPVQVSTPAKVLAPTPAPVTVSAPAAQATPLVTPKAVAPATAPKAVTPAVNPAYHPLQPSMIQPVVTAPTPAPGAFAAISPITQLEILMQQATTKLEFEQAIVLREKIKELMKDPQTRAVYELELQMREAARRLDFEKAVSLRDRVRELQQQIFIPLPAEVVAPPKAKAPELKFRLSKVLITGNERIAIEEIQPLTKSLLGKEVTLTDVRAAASEIKAYYRKKGFIAAYVYVPKQTIEKNGQVELRVVEGRLGAIAIEGNKWFSSELLSDMIKKRGFEPGTVIIYQNLRNGLLDINEHRDMQARAVLRPGQAPGTTDMLLQVEDHMPFHVSVDTNNYGTRLTGKERGGITVSHTNLTGRLDEITGRFQGSEGSYGIAADYNTPIFPAWGTRAGFGFVRGDIDLTGEFKALDVEGEATTYSPYILQPIHKSEMWETSVKLGFDRKSVTNRLLDTTTGRDEIRMISTVLNVEETDKYGKTFWPHSVHVAVDAFGASEQNDPGLTRFGSGAPFVIYRSQLDRYQYLPYGMQMGVHAAWQASPDKLPSSEQFQLGGMSNVRGYPQGEYLGDVGATAQFELLVPPYFIPKDWKIPYSNDLVQDAVKLVGFYDLGMADLNSHLPGEASSKDITGAGIGIRMRLYDKFTARVEWAYPLSETTSDASSGVLYYGMSMDLI